MKYVKFFENFNSNYDYDMILRIMKKVHGWGNGCSQYFDDFENNGDYFKNPEDSHLYANEFHVFLTDLQTGRLRGQFHKVPSGLRPGVWKMSIPVYKPPTIQKYL